MAQIIDLAARSSADRIYRELLGDTLERLDAAADMLLEDLVNLAMRGPWREWSEEQQVGAVASIGEEKLAECGDPRIVELTRALRTVREAVASIRAMDGPQH